MIYPLACMIFLTIAIGVITFAIRVNSVRTGAVKAKDYKLMDAKQFPENVVKATRCFNNQFEIPILFYVACLASIALQIALTSLLILAWTFVVTRVLHASILISYNHLLHRIIAFWSGIVVLVAMWVILLANA